ncbi:hypothetical protein SteCoe_24194 [Stentor coeruleus]|uniref:Uncharacterized protein n=1 Tax=Stentor coeruleus TaxID=5963 RepID=A0A1R2BI55_9CILI|nr:hypothetical protein SteCoe_24194 [Stentor coeruleus]
MKNSQKAPSNYYTHRASSSWGSKKVEYDERIKELEIRKADFLRQKQTAEELKKKNLFEGQNTTEGLQINLKIVQEEYASLDKILSGEREKLRIVEKELETCKKLNRELEAKNRSAQAQIIEKDRILSRYLCELLILKQEVEKIVNPSSEICNNIKNSLSLLYSNEGNKDIIAEKDREDWVLASLKSPVSAEKDLQRLQKQLSETQDLYRMTNNQLQSLIEKTARQDKEYMAIKSKLQGTRNEFGNINNSVIRNNSEKDFQSKSLLVELEELRKKRDEQEMEIMKLEQRYKGTLKDIENDLKYAREKILELIEGKSKIENDLLGLKNEKKELLTHIAVKDLKISDLNASISSYAHEVTMLKDFLKSKVGESSFDYKTKQKYEAKIKDLLNENERLQGKISLYDSERQKILTENRNTSKTIVQQLSNIILSKDHGTLDSKDLTKTLSKILVENRGIFESILHDYFGDDFESLREIMQDKYEEMAFKIDTITKENSKLQSQLRIEGAKRNEVMNRLHELEDEMTQRRSDDEKSKKNTTGDCFNGDGQVLIKKNFEDSPDYYMEKSRKGHTRPETLATEHSECEDAWRRMEKNGKRAEEFISCVDLLHFLQCEAAALDSLLDE